MDNELLARIQQIRDRMHHASIANHRSPKDIKLLMATKTVPATRIRTALASGEEWIAENKIQELKEKYEDLLSVPHTNHFIGHLQSNKVKDLIKYEVQCLHSLDRWSLAEKLQARLTREEKTMDVLVQVNTTEESSKFGLEPKAVEAFIRKVATLDRLKIKGLMTIGLFSGDEFRVRACFRQLRRIQEEIAAMEIPGVEMKELSMGMSGDLEWAIAEGATIIRIGTAIFGPRPYPDHYYWNEKGAETD